MESKIAVAIEAVVLVVDLLTRPLTPEVSTRIETSIM